MTDKETQTRRPDLFVHTKILEGRGTRIGSRIGVAFYHQDGVGLNIILDAMPIPTGGRIELIVLPPKDTA